MTVWSPKPRTCHLDLSLSGLSVSHCQERLIVRSLSFFRGVPLLGGFSLLGAFQLSGGSHVGSFSLSWGSHCQEFFTVGRSRCRECSGSFVVKYDLLNPSSYPSTSSSYLCHTFVIPLFEHHGYDTKMISYKWQRCHKIQHSEMRFARQFMYLLC